MAALQSAGGEQADFGRTVDRLLQVIERPEPHRLHRRLYTPVGAVTTTTTMSIVTDSATGQMWTQSDSGTAMNWLRRSDQRAIAPREFARTVIRLRIRKKDRGTGRRVSLLFYPESWPPIGTRVAACRFG